jgi:hypothetical protein
MKTDDEDKSLRELQVLLDREQEPSASARSRFMAKLQQHLNEPQAVASPQPNRLVAWFQSWWPAQPIGAVSYSAALLAVGLLAGQLLPPRSLGIGMDAAQLARQDLSGERLIQLCNVPPPPADSLL